MLAMPLESPATSPAVLTVATTGALDPQIQLAVTFWVELSIKVAVTVICCVVPTPRTGLSGVICSPLLFSARAVTARFVFPLRPSRVALIEVVPTATVVANPPVVIVAIFVRDEAQVTVLVITLVVPSEYAPVAVNCCVFEASTAAFLVISPHRAASEARPLLSRRARWRSLGQII